MFSKDFVWGAASSSYQIEGYPQEDGGGLSIWDNFCKIDGNIADGSDGSVAADSYHLYKEDIACAKKIGLTAYRFSISWARLDPTGEGLWNEKGFEYYNNVVDCCLENGITPYITLYHWELPQALQDKGGLLNRETVFAFERYAIEVAKRFGSKVKNYITLNEIECSVWLGHGNGIHAPGLKLPMEQQLMVMHHLILCHGYALRGMKNVNNGLKIGIATTGRLCYPETNSEADIKASYNASFETKDDDWAFTHHMILDPICFGHYPLNADAKIHEFAEKLPESDMDIIKAVPDFIGLNIYNGSKIRALEDGTHYYVPHERGADRTAVKWPITPEIMNWGVRYIYNRYRLPIYITENGQSCNDRIFLDGKVHDLDRIDFLTRYLSELEKVSKDEADLRGYFQWSLTDNFEWNEGYQERFGLVYVNYQTGERILKDSALWYGELIKKNKA